jgi:uncharacterized membrane protein
MKHVKQFIIAFIVFMIIDLLWLGVFAWPIYKHFLGPFLQTPPNWPVAVLFYILFIIGMIVFVIDEAITQSNIKLAFKKGALFGFFTYMTYELTNWAVIANWPVGIVPIDILWGTVLSASVCGLTTFIYLKLVK